MPAPDVRDRVEHLLEVGRAEAALALLSRDLPEEPGDGRALRLFWLANSRLGRHEEALRWADRAVSVEPHGAASWIYRATTLLELDRHDEAVTALRRAIELAPDNWLTHYMLGRAMLDTSAEPGELLGVATTVVSLAPEQAEAHVLLGLVHDKTGDNEAAAAAYRAALAIDPGNAGARNNLARIDLLAHRSEQAASGFQDALTLDPQSAPMQENLGKSAALPLIKQAPVVFLVLLVLVAIAVNIEPPYWIRGVLALVVLGEWGLFWWLRVGRLAAAVRRQLFAQVKVVWEAAATRGVVIGLAIEAVCTLVALLVPGGRLVADLVLGGGAVVAVVVMAWTYKRAGTVTV